VASASASRPCASASRPRRYGPPSLQSEPPSRFAAVYNVPLAGALFTAEILLGSISLPVILPAVVCSVIATATAWVYLPDRAIYPGIPDYRFSGSLMAWALLAGPVIGLIAAGYIRLIGVGVVSPGQGDPGAVRAGDRLRRAGRRRDLVPAAVRERPGHGQ
jgi:hypothetical protein